MLWRLRCGAVQVNPVARVWRTSSTWSTMPFVTSSIDGVLVAISDRVKKALIDFTTGEYDNALIQINIAIDASGGKSFPAERNSGTRSKLILSRNEPFILWFASGGRIHSRKAGQLLIPSTHAGSEMSDWLYGIIRCGLLHEADISSQVKFTEAYSFGRPNDKYLVSTHLMAALALVIVGEEANSDESFREDVVLEIGGNGVELERFWGRKQALWDACSEAFRTTR